MKEKESREVFITTIDGSESVIYSQDDLLMVWTYLLPPLNKMPNAMYFIIQDCCNPLWVFPSSGLQPASLSTSRNL